MLAVIGVWLVLTLGYGYATVQAKLALPPSPELYTNSAAFQALGFLTFKVPPLLVLLFVVLGFQILFLHSQPPVLSRADLRHVRRTLVIGIVLMALALVAFMVTADIKYNPWLQYDEQLILAFLLKQLPIYAVLLGLVLCVQIWRLKSRASQPRAAADDGRAHLHG